MATKGTEAWNKYYFGKLPLTTRFHHKRATTLYDLEGKNRISAAILKLSNKDINLVQHYIEKSNFDFRDVIAEAEYKKCSTHSFEEIQNKDMSNIYYEDWTEYSQWLEKK